MIVWDGVKIEFFDPKIDLPENKEFVLVITKKDTIWGDGRQSMIMCTTYITKKGVVRFSHEQGYKFYTVEDIQCWGRLIKS